LLSTEYKDKVLQFISDDLQQNWNSGTSDTIDSVLTQLSLSIIRKNTELLPLMPTTTDLNPLNYNQTEVKIGKLVQSYIYTILNLGANEIEKLKNKGYSKRTFNINYPFLKKITANEPKQDKYWKTKYTVNNYCYVVCSEWFKSSLPFFKAYINKMNIKNNTKNINQEEQMTNKETLKDKLNSNVEFNNIEKQEAIKIVNRHLQKVSLNNKNTHISKINASKDVWWFGVPIERFSDDLNLLLKSANSFIWLKINANTLTKPQNVFKITPDNKRVDLEISSNKQNNYMIDIKSGGENYNFNRYIEYEFNYYNK
jgi:hypothetical protein